MKNLILSALALVLMVSLCYETGEAQVRYQIPAADQSGVLLDTLVNADTSVYVLPRTIISVGQLAFQYDVQDTISGGAVVGTYSVQYRIHTSAGWAELSNGNLPTAPLVGLTGSSQGSLVLPITNTQGYQYRLVARNTGSKTHSSKVFAYWIPSQIPLSND